jgi:hypothetical protein
MFFELKINALSFNRSLGEASRDHADGALSSAAVLRVGLGPTAPPLCRCAERTIDTILRTWLAFDRSTPAIFSAPALGLGGAAT